MSEEMMLRYCAPTLAGLKTGSLLTCPMGARRRCWVICARGTGGWARRGCG